MTKNLPIPQISPRALILGVSVFLVVISWITFGATLHHEFINYDDSEYVYDNPEVSAGVSVRGIVWAFTHSHSNNWHPLTWISHMLDCQLFHLDAGGHHFTNVLLHTVTVVLLFLVLWRMTGAVWKSGFVAAVFAIHPLRAESVAWVAERKDILCGVFFMLTLAAYLRYARQPSAARYITMSILFGLGLMTKPMLITLPFVLLLLDWWPLQRFAVLPLTKSETERDAFGNSRPRVRRLILEKIPLLALSAASALATTLAQKNAINSIERFPFGLRISNAIVSYAIYLWQLVWPSKLALFYPHPEHQISLVTVVLSSVLLISITAAAFVFRRTCPYLFIGWSWYLLMLIPVIGIVQVGSQGHADRYTYLPQIGLGIAAAWGITDLTASWRYRRQILGVGALIIICALCWCASLQTAYWHDSESLWNRSLSVTSNNSVAHTNLGNGLLEKGRVDEAISHLEKVIAINPNYRNAHYNLGTALRQKGRLNEAISHFEAELRIQPSFAGAEINLGNALLQKGEVDRAIDHYRKGLNLDSENPVGHLNLAGAYLKRGEMASSIVAYEKVLAMQPVNADAHDGLAIALMRENRADEAILHWQEAIRIQPTRLGSQVRLAWVLATSPNESVRNGKRAVDLAQQALQYSRDGNPMILRTLAAAYAESGQFAEAIGTAQRALDIANSQGKTALADELHQHLELYQNNCPLRVSRE